MNLRLQHIANEFWQKVPLSTTFPRDIEGTIATSTPLIIVILSELSFFKIADWFCRRNIMLQIGLEDRLLHGFIVLFKSSGFIFINGSDSYEERRMTAAHELAHYILDYQLHRQRAIDTLGPTIAEVIDGLRPATTSERLSGLLSSVSLKPYTHIVEAERGNEGFYDVWKAENDADHLAVELLAPVEQIKSDVQQHGKRIDSYMALKAFIQNLLITKYGLPKGVANGYSGSVALHISGGPSIQERLGLF